jgi:hypothetical protein
MPMLESYDVILCETGPGYVFDGPQSDWEENEKCYLESNQLESTFSI